MSKVEAGWAPTSRAPELAQGGARSCRFCHHPSLPCCWGWRSSRSQRWRHDLDFSQTLGDERREQHLSCESGTSFSRHLPNRAGRAPARSTSPRRHLTPPFSPNSTCAFASRRLRVAERLRSAHIRRRRVRPLLSASMCRSERLMALFFHGVVATNQRCRIA
jgi:hypothetical protein